MISTARELQPGDWVAWQDDTGRLRMATVLAPVEAGWYAIELDDDVSDAEDPDALPAYLQRGLEQLGLRTRANPVCAHASRDSLVLLAR